MKPFSNDYIGRYTFATLFISHPGLHFKKARIYFYVLAAILFLNSALLAQAPVITKNVGMPTGVTSATGVAYGNNVYVSILSNGLIYTSANGDVWSKVENADLPLGQLNRIAFGAGIFVAVGYNGLIITSTDGLVWTSRASGTTGTLHDVQFIQSKFYAVGVNRTIRTSTDGLTWATVTVNTGTATDYFSGITYGNGVFAMSARSSSSGGVYIYRSTTGASNSWTFQDVVFGSINRVQFLKDKFFIFTSGTAVYTSTDASSWTNSTASMIVTLPNATTTTIGSPNQVFHGIYDGSKIYLYGYSNYNGSYGAIYSSTNGVNFTLEPKTVYIVGQGAAYINNKYFQFGNEGLISSTDGINYKYSGGSYYGLASNGTSYVGVGAVSNSGIIFSSNDFTNWTSRASISQKPLYAVTYTGTKYVAVGAATVVESTDGVSWTQISTPTSEFYALAYGATRLVAGGWDTDAETSNLAYSSNGVSWTNANTANNYYFKIKYVNGNFFALGYSNDTYEGIIMHSTDGLSWTDITPTLAYPVYYFNDVVHDGTKYHFMGMEYVDLVDYDYDDFFSVSTSTVTDPNSFANKGTITSPPLGALLGGEWGEGAFAYANGHFVGAVNDVATKETYAIYSTDGVSWTATPLDELTGIYGIAAQGNDFKLLGTGDGKIAMSFGATLPVGLKDFRATLVKSESLLTWKTVTELNSHQFTIQHSSNGTDWKNIGVVQATGESQSIRNYEFTHADPLQGVNYYRLIQTDLDSKQQFSQIVKVIVGGKMNLAMFPNPAKEYVQLQLPGSGPATISIFNSAGQQVYHGAHTEKNIQLSLQQFRKGIFRVIVQQDGQRYARQLVHE